MHVEVSLGGFTSPWTFAGTKKFRAWSENKPWQREGGLCVIRTSNPNYDVPIIRTIEHIVRGANGNGALLRVQRIDCGGIHGTPFGALLVALEIDRNLSPFEAREPIRMRLLDKPTVFVFVESPSDDAVDWDPLVNLVEHYRKAKAPVNLCSVIVDSRCALHFEPVCDFTVGRCTHQVFGDAVAQDEPELWPAYVHQRLCWESGGNLGYAISLAESISSVAPGDDEAFEAHLQSHASVALLAHSEFPNLKIFVGLDTNQSGEDRRRARHLLPSLLQRHLLWNPPGIHLPRIVPWVSRILLGLPSLPGRQTWTLRHNLVCAPLASEIITLCLQSESHIRSRIHGKGDVAKLSPQTSDSFDRFTNGNDDAVWYPAKHPSPPDQSGDIWAFASLGDALHSCPKSAVSDLDLSTLRLRNALAHGHYVGWHQVKLALKQLRYFSTSC